MKRILLIFLAVLVLIVVVAIGASVYLWRRALPDVDGDAVAAGISNPVEIIRDRWGIPHIFASSDRDAYFALGWTMAQERLFQIDLVRRVSNGRLAEMMGPDVIEVDRLFRTVNIPGIARRMATTAEPKVREALEAYRDGVNASAAAMGGALPIEYTLLGIGWDPVTVPELAAVIGFMTWDLNPAWKMDRLYERIVNKVGRERAAQLFPHTLGGKPAVFPAISALSGAPPLEIAPALRLTAEQEALLAGLSGLESSNTWVVGPAKSASGAPILANDPHLALRLPSIWFQAHLKTPTLDVAGMILPGSPFVTIGRNRDIAWGLTNLMADAGDFFVEKLHPDDPEQVMYKGQWVPVKIRTEEIRIKGGETEILKVRETPHGPIVSEFLKETTRVLSYQWVYAVAEDANELDGFHALNRARDWREFRQALSRFGAAGQNISFAGRDGHIGLQAAGRIPKLRTGDTGNRFRIGWNGLDEWEGFVPFEEMPKVFDPPEGYVSAANNPTFPSSGPFYISAYWEPRDRILRIRELIAAQERLSAEDMARMQTDILWITAREEAPRILQAYEAAPAPTANVRAALELLRGWNGSMDADSRAATVFAAFFKHLFHELFADELGQELASDLREKGNYSAGMIHAVLDGGLDDWYDRGDTPEKETRGDVFRAAFEAGVAELESRMGKDPASWQWGKLHNFTLTHPLGKVEMLAPLFNAAAIPLPGHSLTIWKAQYKDGDFAVYHGASMRQITDFAGKSRTQSVIPGGQSGIPASPHYTDLLPLWAEGRYHPLAMEREEIETFAASRLVLNPR